MIKVDKEKLIKELNLSTSGMAGWYEGNCVFCGGTMKMGLRLYNERGGDPKFIGYNCFSGSCGKSGGILELLKHIGRLDLATIDESIQDREILDMSAIMPKDHNKITLLGLEVEKISPPMGFEPVSRHPYLKGRNFTKDQYTLFNVGISSSHPRFMRRKIRIVRENGSLDFAHNEYIISMVKNDGEFKAYLGRSMLPAEVIKNNNTNAKLMAKVNPMYKEYVISKYINSVSSFEKLLLGYDEIIAGKTKTVILVEGWFDKSKTDTNLNLYLSDTTKAVCSFGKKLSDYQIAKLLIKGVENIIVMYDPDAIMSTKALSLYLCRYFRNVSVAILNGMDPGDATREDVTQVMNNLITPIQLSRMII